MTPQTPSSGAPRHLLPQGEKGSPAPLAQSSPFTASPSPLVGEGARRADEGAKERPSSRLQQFAREMRHEPTQAEKALWDLLRNRRLEAYKFRRQVPIGPYIADFVCYSAKLIVEADGSQHVENVRDQVRDAELHRRGFFLLRLPNELVMNTPTAALNKIWAALHGEIYP